MFVRLKLLIDRDRRSNGRFILTGSSQFASLRHVSDSLAGRIGLLTLLPFQHSETPAARRGEAIWKGTYPELIVEKYAHREEWYSSYLETCLTRDVRELGGVGDLRDFRRCLVLLAGRIGQLLNLSELARDLGVSVNTVKRWISVMEASFIVYLLKPFNANIGKRLVLRTIWCRRFSNVQRTKENHPISRSSEQATEWKSTWLSIGARHGNSSR